MRFPNSVTKTHRARRVLASVSRINGVRVEFIFLRYRTIQYPNAIDPYNKSGATCLHHAKFVKLKPAGNDE